MKRPVLISWDNFCSTIMVKGEQRMHKVSNSPRIDFFWDGVENRMGIWLETTPESSISTELSKLSFISLQMVSVGSHKVMEVTTSAKPLMRQFYHFAVAVAERMVANSSPALEAVASELQCFADLLAEHHLLSAERQIGLLGELLFLEKLVSTLGINLIDSWVGPQAEPHDFRVGNREFEVKTTVSPYRVHTIHGSEQLVPSKMCTLFLLSVLLGPPGTGDGFSLAGKALYLEKFFESDHTRARQFLSTLEQMGLHKADYPYFQRQFALRRPLAIVPVNKKFPALTRPTLQASLGPFAQRIESLQYTVNIEGLEREEGSANFEAALTF